MENISSPRKPINGGLGTKTGRPQVKGGMDGRTNANKDSLITEVPQAGGKFGEHQLPQHAASIVYLPLQEHPPTQLELVGHSIACAPYLFSDPCYEGAVPAYGPQALVHSHCVGVHSTRMALPLEMTEEPVYVNAKQYHGILRRRQLRAKAELKKKPIKVRKSYQHESRHLHAMRRARGCGGRFLNTKKPDSQASNANQIHSSVPVSTQSLNSSSPKSVPTHYSRSVDSSTGHRDVTEPQMQEMQLQQKYFNSNAKTYLDLNDNSNGFFLHHQGFQLFKYHSSLDNKVEAGDFSRQQIERTVANRAQQKALTIK